MGEVGNARCEPRSDAICFPLEGNGARPSHRGEGFGMSGDPMFTLNSTERHGVCVWNGKADGASGQGVSFAITGDHDNRPTDMTNIIVMENEEGLRSQQTAFYRCLEEICTTLDAHMGSGGGNVPIVLENDEESIRSSEQRERRVLSDG